MPLNTPLTVEDIRELRIMYNAVGLLLSRKRAKELVTRGLITTTPYDNNLCWGHLSTAGRRLWEQFQTGELSAPEAESVL